MSCSAVPRSPGIRRQAHSARIDPTSQHGGTMRFDAVLFDNGGTLTHRTSPVAAVRALSARPGAGTGKPAPGLFLTGCEGLEVSPEGTLMVGNNRLADSGSICVGCHCLILPPVPPGATRGLRAATDVAGIAWVA